MLDRSLAYFLNEVAIRSKRLVPLMLLVLVAGCAKPLPSSEYSWELYEAPTVTPETFTGQTVAILPAVKVEFDPSQETYREAIGGIMYAAITTNDGNPRILPLDAVRSLVNRADMWSDLQSMYKEYQNTAVLRRDVLAKLGKALGARYVLLPKVLRFQQEVFDRVTIIGISFLRTRQSTVDIQVQIWDTETGDVVWHGVGEGSQSAEVVEGRPVSFMSVAQYACASLATRLPWVKNAQAGSALKEQSPGVKSK